MLPAGSSFPRLAVQSLWTAQCAGSLSPWGLVGGLLGIQIPSLKTSFSFYMYVPHLLVRNASSPNFVAEQLQSQYVSQFLQLRNLMVHCLGGSDLGLDCGDPNILWEISATWGGEIAGGHLAAFPPSTGFFQVPNLRAHVPLAHSPSASWPFSPLVITKVSSCHRCHLGSDSERPNTWGCPPSPLGKLCQESHGGR